MSRGNWGILAAAIFGLTIFSAIGGYTIAALDHPKAERYPDYVETGDSAGNTNTLTSAQNTTTPRHKRPCRNPESREESDLCAQWVAANAARSNLLWTERQFWIGLVTALGLGFTIVLTLRAVLASERALEHAREISYQELRAHVSFGIPTVKAMGDDWNIYFPIKNTGQTPAYDFRLTSLGVFIGYPINAAVFDEIYSKELAEAPITIAPQNERGQRFLFKLGKAEMEDIEALRSCLAFRVQFSYSTYAGERVDDLPWDWRAGPAEFAEGTLTRTRHNDYVGREEA